MERKHWVLLETRDAADGSFTWGSHTSFDADPDGMEYGFPTKRSWIKFPISNLVSMRQMP